MLQLEHITKKYKTGAYTMEALRDVSIRFRSSEFVAILGHSGSGKTTLLNIIGGLDRYTAGNLRIRGKDTRKFRSRDWDTYRNHSVGFVFQGYHLIPHQSVFSNVELALTLCGVRRSERRRRTKNILEKVGLGNQMHKKPGQLSGGQMQRVAIARALINDPEILLADEPTGSLDSETAEQIMELLQEIAKDRLVIMVTHNHELADRYASRIVTLKDGRITSDSAPWDDAALQTQNTKVRRTFMSPLTSFSLSLSNLMTKKGRAILVSFAGSIGIVGIAIILSLASAVNNYVTLTEKNLLSNYPLSITAYTSDLSALMPDSLGNGRPEKHRSDVITTANTINSLLGMLADGAVHNDLKAFKAYIESGQSGLEAFTTDIRYSYATDVNIYRSDGEGNYIQVNPNKTFASVRNVVTRVAGEEMADQYDVFRQVASDTRLLENQYDLLAGKLPKEWNELVLVLNANGQISDFTLYSLDVLDRGEVSEAISAISDGRVMTFDNSHQTYDYEDFLGMTFKVLPTPEHFKQQDNGTWKDMTGGTNFIREQVDRAEELVIVGVIRPKPDTADLSPNGIVGYTADLMEHLIDVVNASQAVRTQKAEPGMNIFTGKPFEASKTEYTLEELEATIPSLDETLQTEFTETIARMKAAGSTDEEIAAELSPLVPVSQDSATYEGNLSRLGVCQSDTPSAIELYPINFEAKEQIKDCIRRYNEGKAQSDRIVYADYVGILMQSVTTVVDAVSYVIVAFVAISLMVSSIMTGIITNISVLERTKEIGILRAIGASRRDIARVFNAESAIIGLMAGLVGIGLTELLITGINLVIRRFTDQPISVALEPGTALVLVGISVALTLIAGILPARRAANRDPVIALRTE